MNNKKRFSTVALFMAMVMGMWGNSAVAEVKIGVVDVQTAILSSEEAKRLLAQIQEEFKADEATMRGIQSSAAELLQRMQKDADVMSESEKARIQKEIESLNNDFVYQRQKLQRAIEERQQELFSGVQDRVQRAIEDLVMDEDFDIILPRQAALYATEVYNITRKVTEKLNSYDSASR